MGRRSAGQGITAAVRSVVVRAAVVRPKVFAH